MSIHLPTKKTVPQDKWLELVAILNEDFSKIQHNLSYQRNKQFLYRLIADNILALLLQYIGLMFCVLTLRPIPLWLATGTACAFIFLRGPRILLGMTLGSFIAFYSSGSGFILAIIGSALFSSYSFILFFICSYYISQTLLFYRLNTLIKFIFFSHLLSAIFSYLMVEIYYSVLHHELSFLALWLEWYLAMENSLLIIACAIITWDAYYPQINRLQNVDKPTLYFLFSLLCLLLLILSFTTQPMTTICLAVLICLLSLLLTKQFGWCGAISAGFLIGIWLILSACLLTPIFLTPFAKFTAIFLQFMISIAITLDFFLAIINKRFT